MKNPNGYGTVVKLSGNRRNPYAVRKTLGFNEKGHPIYQAIGYAPTREAGMLMLAEYNRNPYDIDLRKITVAQVYQRWSERDFPKMNKSTVSVMKSVWKHCEPVYNVKYRELKAYQMQDCIDKCGCGYSTQGAIKALFGHLDRFALELDIIAKQNSILTSAAPIPETKKVPFTEEEISLLWENSDREWVDTVLILLYSGWRISELLELRTENIDLENATMTGGTKTRNGKNRIVPIHPRIMPFIEKHYNKDNERLFPISLSQYYDHWNSIMSELNMEHTPHECRHTFRSRLDSAGANKVCIDMLMGHKSKEVGERVYTHKTIEELRSAINLLP